MKVNRSFEGIYRLRLQARKVTKDGITRSKRRSERLHPEVTTKRNSDPTSYGIGVDRRAHMPVNWIAFFSKKQLNQSV